MFDTPLEDWAITREVLSASAEMKRKHDVDLAKYNAHLTANRTVSGVSKTLRKLMAALRAAQG